MNAREPVCSANLSRPCIVVQSVGRHLAQSESRRRPVRRTRRHRRRAAPLENRLLRQVNRTPGLSQVLVIESSSHKPASVIAGGRHRDQEVTRRAVEPVPVVALLGRHDHRPVIRVLGPGQPERYTGTADTCLWQDPAGLREQRVRKFEFPGLPIFSYRLQLFRRELAQQPHPAIGPSLRAPQVNKPPEVAIGK